MTIGVNGQQSELSRAGLALSIPIGPKPRKRSGLPARDSPKFFTAGYSA